MHGHRRDEYKARLADPKTAAGLAQKAQQWNTLMDQLLLQCKSGSDSTVTTTASTTTQKQQQQQQQAATAPAQLLALTEKLLLVNPDPLVLWNIRRRLLQAAAAASAVAHPPTRHGNTRQQYELMLTQQCLERNPKAYGAWFHRKWWLMTQQRNANDSIPTDDTTAASSTMDTSDADADTDVEMLLQNELDLCNLFLLKDERNFHCWNYRRFIVGGLLQNFWSTTTTTMTTTLLDGSWSLLLPTAAAPTAQSHSQHASSVMMGAQIVVDKGNVVEVMDNRSASSAAAAVFDDATSSTEQQCQQQQVQQQTRQQQQQSLLLDSEWDFCTTKIEQNFSNYSAFDYRSKLLLLKIVQQQQQRQEQRQESLDAGNNKNNNNNNNNSSSNTDKNLQGILEGELELVHNAIFTEPDDQTAWWYYRFLLVQVLPKMADNAADTAATADAITAASRSWCVQLLQSEKALLDELNEAEDYQSKWTWLGLHVVLTELQKHRQEASACAEEAEMLVQDDDDVEVCLNRLIELDPDRASRYVSMKHKKE